MPLSHCTCSISSSYRSHRALNSFLVGNPRASWIRRLRSLLLGAQTQPSCCEPRVRDLSQLGDCVPAGFRLFLSGADLLISSSFGKASSPPRIPLLVCFHAALTRTHLPRMLNVPFTASAKSWLKVKPPSLQIFSV